MASDKIIHGRINVDAIKKEWLFKGEKGTYLDFTMFYNEEQDQYQNNGMITQSVPNAVFKKEKDLPKDERSKGPILGNAKEFSKVGNREESSPGYTGKSKAAKETKTDDETTPVEENDDLPF
jgi:hypothetical protein